MKKLTLLLATFAFSMLTFSQVEEQKGFVKEIYLGTNFASLIRNQVVYFPEKNKYLTTNPYVNIEADVKLHSKFSIRIPFGFGLGNLDGKILEGGSLPNHWFDSGPDFSPYALNTPGWYLNGPRLDTYPISVLAACNLRCFDQPVTFARPQDLKYQIGFFPKFTFNKSEAIKISFTVGANFGYIDKYAISEYNSFTSIKNAAGDTNIGWIQTESTLVFEKNPFFFIRGEYLLGFDIKISKQMGLNIETGFAHFVNGHGLKPDNIYTNLDNNGYNLIQSDFRNTDSHSFSDDSYRLKTVPFYFINRFSIRYRIK